MAESSKEELVQLIKRFGAYLTVKISNLLPISLQRLALGKEFPQVHLGEGMDVWRWKRTSTGIFDTRSFYCALSLSYQVKPFPWRGVWGVKAPWRDGVACEWGVGGSFIPALSYGSWFVEFCFPVFWGEPVCYGLSGLNAIGVSLRSVNVLRDSRSLGAFAGLAFALVFTWRLLRSPSQPQRRQPKRQAATPSSSAVSAHSNATLVPHGGSSSLEDSRAQNVVDEFFQPVKPTLGQIVRQKLSEGRKVTCRLLGVILEESSPEELQKQATVRSSVLEVLLEITKFCDLYLMERVLDDESEKKVLLALEDAGVFTSGGLVKDKVLFCSIENGRSSFVRQLEPDWHIDTNPEIVSQLARFIKYQLHISAIRPERTAPNVFSAPTLEQFFGCV
uniref:Peroxisome biogenesis protein 22 n=1 Tax=Fagus sylvatica TaxID=28930 RepID=A0A2N9IY30_FAGSY